MRRSPRRSTLVVTGFAAVVGVVIAREFGRTEETDGFFAAYGVFIVIVLASQAIRIAVLPSLARARGGAPTGGSHRRIRDRARGRRRVPLLARRRGRRAEPIADLLTGSGSAAAQDVCADALRWIVPAAVAHLFAGLAASGLAALDDYATAALGYALGSTAGADDDPDPGRRRTGSSPCGWGMALNGAISLAVPVVGLAWRALRARMPRGAVRPTGPPLRSRLGIFATAAALPIALQLLYVICLPFAGRRRSRVR